MERVLLFDYVEQRSLGYGIDTLLPQSQMSCEVFERSSKQMQAYRQSSNVELSIVASYAKIKI
jgi:hypothetical protein